MRSARSDSSKVTARPVAMRAATPRTSAAVEPAAPFGAACRASAVRMARVSSRESPNGSPSSRRAITAASRPPEGTPAVRATSRGRAGGVAPLACCIDTTGPSDRRSGRGSACSRIMPTLCGVLRECCRSRCRRARDGTGAGAGRGGCGGQGQAVALRGGNSPINKSNQQRADWLAIATFPADGMATGPS